MAFKKIDDSKILCIWMCYAGKCDNSEVTPDWYEQNGTPVCECGDDMQYSHTEIEEN